MTIVLRKQLHSRQSVQVQLNRLPLVDLPPAVDVIFHASSSDTAVKSVVTGAAGTGDDGKPVVAETCRVEWSDVGMVSEV